MRDIHPIFLFKQKTSFYYQKMKYALALLVGILIGGFSVFLFNKGNPAPTEAQKNLDDCKFCRIQFPADDLETVVSLTSQLLEARKQNPENPALTIKSGQTNWNMVCTLEDCVLGYD